LWFALASPLFALTFDRQIWHDCCKTYSVDRCGVPRKIPGQVATS
jgi:hypothetical protein